MQTLKDLYFTNLATFKLIHVGNRIDNDFKVVFILL
jgi:hypothetical protein